MKTVAENARQSLNPAQEPPCRRFDHPQRLPSWSCRKALELPDPLLRIECYDISHVQGTNVVASMVVFEDGMPAKNAYRTYSITGDAAL